MDRRSLAQELRRWVVEEMGLTPQKAPSEDILQRLFIGQCADIWKYVIRHVYNQRTVRNIEGNLLWYQQLQHSEAQRSAKEEEQQRRKQLCREILDLRSEVQHLQEQIHNAEREIVSRDLNNERSQDFCRRSLLLQAFKKKRETECEALCESTVRIQFRCQQLRDINRLSQRDVAFGTVDSGVITATYPEPEVLRDVRDVCQMRYDFLQSLHDDSLMGSVPVSSGDARSLSHQQWMSVSEKIWSSYAPNHVLSALQRLALETTEELRHLQSSFASDRAELSRNASETSYSNQEEPDPSETFKPSRSVSEGVQPDRSEKLPSFKRLLQEGWGDSVKVSSQLHLVQHQVEELSERLASIIQETHKTLSDGNELTALTRAAFDAELRAVLLRGCRDGLLLECRALQDEAAEKMQGVKLLQQQQQNIQDSCHLLEKKQNQIQILIKGNSASKAQIQRSRAEAQTYIQEKLLPRPQEVIQESQRLQDSIQKEVKHFSAIFLPALQKVCADGVNHVPAHELSINRLSHVNSPYYNTFKGLYESLGVSIYKAPECILGHVADLKKHLFFLRAQLTSRNQAVHSLQRKLREKQNPDTEALLRLLSEHYAEQTERLVPKLQHLIQQCEKSQEYGREVQATVSDWWEQPAQRCLPWEQRGGLTLQQWRDRWTVAATALQRAAAGRR
ncbi:HAUS augmin-like complex subunit 5 [Spea bombifrons]|uniref:HAUS augmin-like complex subunit 5 n=1 Tax=Spea bombifrons TaxID=233779 RepID=UPI00234ACDAC|nr:HAUS augmin-like complex subunit 5 [Spea bombifrons]